MSSGALFHPFSVFMLLFTFSISACFWSSLYQRYYLCTVSCIVAYFSTHCFLVLLPRFLHRCPFSHHNLYGGLLRARMYVIHACFSEPRRCGCVGLFDHSSTSRAVRSSDSCVCGGGGAPAWFGATFWWCLFLDMRLGSVCVCVCVCFINSLYMFMCIHFFEES